MTSVTIDVVNENHNKVTNLHDIPLSEMSIEIVDELGDVTDPVLPVLLFNPLTDEDRHQAAMKFNLKIGKAHVVNIQGQGNRCGYPPKIFYQASGNGLCLFNLVSILLTGSEAYSAIMSPCSVQLYIKSSEASLHENVYPLCLQIRKRIH